MSDSTKALKGDNIHSLYGGILNDDEIRSFCGIIEPSQLQPASLDLRLGSRAWRVKASFLPGRDCTVSDKLNRLSLHEIDLSDSAVLETNCVYIVELTRAFISARQHLRFDKSQEFHRQIRHFHPCSDGSHRKV